VIVTEKLRDSLRSGLAIIAHFPIFNSDKDAKNVMKVVYLILLVKIILPPVLRIGVVLNAATLTIPAEAHVTDVITCVTSDRIL
jgi:hypothetical protein